MENLEWVTNIENKRHYQNTEIAKQINKQRAFRVKEKNNRRIKKEIPNIIQLYLEGKTILKIARQIHTETTTITEILKENLSNFELMKKTRRSERAKILCGKINNSNNRYMKRDKLGRFVGVEYVK